MTWPPDGITITDDRKELAEFSDGYINIEQRLLARIDKDRFDSVQSFIDNADLNIGTQTGTTNFRPLPSCCRPIVFRLSSNSPLRCRPLSPGTSTP